MSQMLEQIPSQADLKKLPIVGAQPKSEKEEKFWKDFATYEFQNLEEPGRMIQFSYGNANHRKTFTLFHGGKYHLPRHIARHLESLGTPIWEYRPDGNGKMQKQKTGYKSRFQMRETFEG